MHILVECQVLGKCQGSSWSNEPFDRRIVGKREEQRYIFEYAAFLE